VEATLVSVSFFVGVFGVGGFFEEVSDCGGFAPLTVSIPSTVTVFPGGSFSTFSSFFFPIKGILEQALRKKKAMMKMQIAIVFFLFRIMKSPFLLSFGERAGLILPIF
jgi:hypothetical protein